MSNKERIIELLDVIPDYKIGYVLAYVQGVAAGVYGKSGLCAEYRPGDRRSGG